MAKEILVVDILSHLSEVLAEHRNCLLRNHFSWCLTSTNCLVLCLFFVPRDGIDYSDLRSTTQH